MNYPTLTTLPAGAVTVREYAKQTGQRWPHYIYVRYNRYLEGKGTHPGYTLAQWQGVCVVILGNTT